MVFDRTWRKMQDDFSRLNPFGSKETQKGPPDGHSRSLDTLNTFGDGNANERYSISQTTYPLDLMEGDGRAHAPYVMLFINVPRGSELAKKNKTAFVEPHNEIRDGRNIRKGLTKDLAVAGSGIATAAIGGGLGAGLLGVSGIGLATGTGFLGAYVMHEYLENIDFNSEPLRLKHAIALHMPNQLDIRYGAQYKNDNAAPFLAYTKLLGTGYNTAKTIVDKIKNEDATFKDVATNIGEGVKSMKNVGMAAALQLMPGGDTISASTQLAPNPKLQTVFEGVDPRTFSFGYSFFARSDAELDNIEFIIKLLRGYMLPEYKDDADGQFLFIYPATFDIEYYVGAEQNKHIHKHTSCVLTNVAVDYTPNGSYAYFNKNGAPIQINVRMDFRELEIITRKDVLEEGY